MVFFLSKVFVSSKITSLQSVNKNKKLNAFGFESCASARNTSYGI